MSLGDSIHLATALQYSATEFQTLDGGGKRAKRIDPLNLNGSVAGVYLRIVKPKFVPPPPPLSGPVPDIGGQQTALLFEPITEDLNEPIKTLPAPTEVPGSPEGSPASEAGTKTAEAGKPEVSQDGQIASAPVSKEEVASTESKTPASGKPAGDAKGGS